jgi:hypothetical protein
LGCRIKGLYVYGSPGIKKVPHEYDILYPSLRTAFGNPAKRVGAYVHVGLAIGMYSEMKVCEYKYLIFG